MNKPSTLDVKYQIVCEDVEALRRGQTQLAQNLPRLSKSFPYHVINCLSRSNIRDTSIRVYGTSFVAFTCSIKLVVVNTWNDYG